MVKQVIYITAIVFGIFVSMTACGQRKEPYDPGRTYSAIQLRSDLQLLRNTMQRIHPGLYDYTRKPRFDRIFDSTAGALHDGMTAMEFRTALIPIISEARCDHTWFDTDDSYQEYLDKKIHYVPFRLKAIDTALYIDENYSADAALLKGTEIKEINGEPASRIIAKLLHTESADGNNQTKLWFALGHDFKDKYADFYGDVPVITLKTRYMQLERFVTIAGLSMDSLNYYKRLRYPQYRPANAKALIFSADSFPQAAYLRVRSFGEGPLCRSGQDIYRFMDSVVTILNKSDNKNLVIDLRGNEGGESKYAMSVFAHLSQKPFIYNSRIISNVMHPFPEMRYTTLTADYFRDSLNFRLLPDGRYMRVNHPLLEEHQPEKINFAGNVYVLMDGGTMSATVTFCTAMHNAKRAVFIGEECGGGYYTCNGNATKLVLPESKVAIGIPMRKFYANATGYPYHDRGLIPDHEVKQTPSDLAGNKDAVLEYALKLIGQER